MEVSRPGAESKPQRSNARSFNPLYQSGDWTRPSAVTRATTVRFLTHCITVGTPTLPSFCGFSGSTLFIFKKCFTFHTGSLSSYWQFLYLKKKTKKKKRSFSFSKNLSSTYIQHIVGTIDINLLKWKWPWLRSLEPIRNPGRS